ncbi:MAG TPA: urate oxidase [Streptosporangiaceae bacterium]
MVQLGANRYGKAEVRVLRVARGAGPGGGDAIRDWNVSTSLSGDLAAAHLTGDNSAVLTTDTQKNTVYAFAQRLGPVPPEVLAMELAAHFTGTQPQITRARVAVEEFGWAPVGESRHSFARTGELTRACRVVHDCGSGVSVVAGIEDLTVLNTTNSEFRGFPRDEYTTLEETRDRMLATQVSAWWRYRGPVSSGPRSPGSGPPGSGPPASGSPGLDWDAAFEVAREALLSAFSETYSYSLQQTLYAIGERIIEAVPDVCEVRLALPNKHHYLVDLAPFGLPNDNEVYYPGDRPYGLIEGTVLADDAPDAGPAWT